MAGNTRTLTGAGGVDTRDFARFAKALRKAAPELTIELRKELRTAGEIVATEARRNADFSTKIPPTVKVRVSSASIFVVAGGKNAPAGAVFEHGGRAGTFRHPVFGNTDVWVSQDAHPFLQPAVDSARPAAANAAVQALDRAVQSVVRDMGV